MNMAVPKKPRRLNGSGSRLKTSGKKSIKNSGKTPIKKKVIKKVTKKNTVLDLKRSKKNPRARTLIALSLE